MTKDDMNQAPPAAGYDGQTLSEVIRGVEEQYLCWALNRTNGNKAKAASLSGLTYKTFSRKLAALKLRVTFRAN